MEKFRIAMTLDPYLIPYQAVIFEQEIKKSHFITYLHHTPDVESVRLFISQVKAKHHDARHNCSAFIAGRPDDLVARGFSDDGEPSGTAGKPMLAQLSGSGVGEITAVVTRYYGGIRLGTGGLVKAYGGSVHQALTMLNTTQKKVTCLLQIILEYSFISVVQSVMKQFDAVETSANYDKTVIIVVELQVSDVDAFTQAIINRTGAKALVHAHQ
jgi:uncharacterized YigZ family protein